MENLESHIKYDYLLMRSVVSQIPVLLTVRLESMSSKAYKSFNQDLLICIAEF
jgi:hypothetical protein